MKRLVPGTTEHARARADYHAGLLEKTSDPVEWEKEKLEEAKASLQAVCEHGFKHLYETPIAMLESALHKASWPSSVSD